VRTASLHENIHDLLRHDGERRPISWTLHLLPPDAVGEGYFSALSFQGLWKNPA
jgi:hypothetical protein